MLKRLICRQQRGVDTSQPRALSNYRPFVGRIFFVRGVSELKLYMNFSADLRVSLADASCYRAIVEYERFL